MAEGVFLGGIAKGSVMVEPNMATTLSFMATNAKIKPELLDELLFECVDSTFNCISTDGCQSTNDMALIIANGVKHGGNYKRIIRSYILSLKKPCLCFLKTCQ